MIVDIVGLFIWLFGLCVGSFLNVVAYRLPRDLSISSPSRSFCPHCGTTLRWSDNLPLVGWLRLGGRCRTCRAAISCQYPIVEAACGLAFVLVYYLLLVRPMRVGLDAPALPGDLPLLLAWLTMAAALLVCAVIDIVSYSVDVRVTLVALWIGLLCYAVWPRASVVTPIGAAPAGAAATAAMLVSAVMLRRWTAGLPSEPDQPEPDAGIDSSASETARPRLVQTLLALALLVVTAATMFTQPGLTAGPHFISPFGLAGVAALFLVMVAAASAERPADDEIHQAVEDESPHARRVALAELVWLLPALLAGVGVYVLLAWVPVAGRGWAAIATFSPGAGIAPLAGIAYALFGAAVGAAAGWAVRIVFTLAFGREAFGTGDIFILAAAGACAGWDIALLGFLLAIAVALLAWMGSLLLKRTAMIAFGPPLALGMLLALLVNQPAARVAEHYREAISTTWHRAPGLLLVLAAILLVGSIVAIVLARWVRHMLESAETHGQVGAD